MVRLPNNGKDILLQGLCQDPVESEYIICVYVKLDDIEKVKSGIQELFIDKQTLCNIGDIREITNSPHTYVQSKFLDALNMQATLLYIDYNQPNPCPKIVADFIKPEKTSFQICNEMDSELLHKSLLSHQLFPE